MNDLFSSDETMRATNPTLRATCPPSMQPRLLDLFCSAGGASTGYVRSGFAVTGVNIALQPNYPYMFMQQYALALYGEFLSKFDAFHAFPPR